MVPPLKFPNHYDVIREEAEAFQKLSGAEQVRIIEEMRRHGNKLVAKSPDRERIEALQNAYEEEFKQAQARALSAYQARHGKSR